MWLYYIKKIVIVTGEKKTDTNAKTQVSVLMNLTCISAFVSFFSPPLRGGLLGVIYAVFTPYGLFFIQGFQATMRKNETPTGIGSQK